MKTILLEMTLSGPDPIAIVRACSELGLAPVGAPSRVEVDDQPVEATEDWLVPALRHLKRQAWAEFSGYPEFAGRPAIITVPKGGPVFIRLPNVEVEPHAFAERLAKVPWELASFGAIYFEWIDGSIEEGGYHGPTFSDLHIGLGWGCAFRGVGHDRLVSRRWLDFGPWRTVRASNDVTLVQFHDLAADAVTALAQARVGHDRMGISDDGGFLQSSSHYFTKLRGIYFPEEKQIRVVVHGRDISQREMLEWCAARRAQAFGPDQPVDSVAFVFVEEDVAQRHIHELWLRDLQCWTVREGEEVRLDASYSPAPSPPAWVRGLP